MSRHTPTDRQKRILQLSHEWGVSLPPVPSRLERPHQVPTYRQSNDDVVAENLLVRRAQEAAQIRPKSGLSRAFSSANIKRGKAWEPRDVLDVLYSWIAQGGSAGVVEALVAKLAEAGVELGGSQRQKSGILNRRKSTDGFVDKTKLLRSAVERDQYQTVQVLLPYADPVSLDACLPIAMRRSNTPLAELLIRYGATAGQSAEGQDAFRQACGAPGHSDMVKLILHSDGKPTPLLASQCLIDAARIGELGTVLQLSRSIADGDFDQASALRTAVMSGRKDIAIAIIMGNKPPQGESLSLAFRALLENPSLTPAARLELAELLICAGAQGDVLSQALQMACDTHFYEMASLLSTYGVSIEYQEAAVLKTAIAKGQIGLVNSLLSDAATLSPSLASSCVRAIPPETTNEDRYLLLNLLLRKGAKGTPLHEILIDATKAGDLNSVELLLKPFFPDRPAANGTRVMNGHVNGYANDVNNMPNGRTPRSASGAYLYERHEVASPDFRDGEAIRTALLRMDTAMTSRLLAGQPSPETLSKVFPLTKNLSTADRYEMVELFLKGALAGPPLHAALQDAISEDPANRDDSLIRLFLQHDADINYNKGSGLTTVILRKDVPLLETLMVQAGPQTAAARVVDVMKLSDRRDHPIRFDMMSLLLRSGAAVGIQEVAAALLETLGEAPVDMSLLRLLLQQGNANVNTLSHAIVKRAVQNPDPKVIEMVLSFGKPNAETLTACFETLAPTLSNDAKAWKLKIILAKSSMKSSPRVNVTQDIHRFLAHEIETLVEVSQQPSLSTLKVLLDAGADPNKYDAVALCFAVKAANVQITDLLVECQLPPTPYSLGLALRHALRIPDPMDRLSFTKKLSGAGAAPIEVNLALTHAITSSPDDLSLIGALTATADTSDGEALNLCVMKESPEILDLLLSRSKISQDARDSILDKTMGIRDRAVRREMCQRLLKDGISTDVASNALLIAARDGDLELGDILMAHGANIASNNGQAIIEACRGGSAEVLEVLLRTDRKTDKTVLERGFQAATEVGDLNKRAVIFEKLLKRGVSGEPTDAQLLSAARYGEAGHEVLRVLLAAGADPNYHNGEAVVAATSSAFMDNLELLLGLWDEKGRQKRASNPTLIRALKASWNLSRDIRFKVIGDLIKAGLPAEDDVHIALNDAVNEDDPEERLVKLLLDHGASPTMNGCKTLIDATQQTADNCLSLILEKQIPQADISRTFGLCFSPDRFDGWFTESGVETARALLNCGAQGAALSSALVSVMKAHDRNAQLADDFFDMLVSYGPDVNHNDGEPLKQAASLAKVGWMKALLDCRPSSQTLSLAFQRIFDTALEETDALHLFEVLTGYRDGETCIDVMTPQDIRAPVLAKAMSSYPRSVTILKTLLDAGYYHDQMVVYQLHEDEDEQMTLLTWALAQPQKKISSTLIQLLLDRGAKVNVETSKSRMTPLMFAIQERRVDLVQALLLDDAEVDVTDHQGRTPLSMATNMGGDIATKMMGNLLAAEPSKDDGSLHNAARELNLAAVQVLVQAGHDPDFPSPHHGGRSALGEVCLRGAERGELEHERQRSMQKVMALLIDSGSDLSIKLRGKSMLHLCFDSADPLTTSRLFLKVGMWKHVNKPLCQYNDGTYTYSPTMYIRKVLPQTDATPQLLELIQANRGTDVFYANEGDQPADAIGLPEDLLAQERERKFREQRIAEDAEDFRISMARKKELASVDAQILSHKQEMEEARRRKAQSEDIRHAQERGRLEESLAAASHARRLSEQRQLAESNLSQRRALAAADNDSEDARQRKALEWQTRHRQEAVEGARALSAVQISERQEIERFDRAAEERMSRRLEAQRKLVEGQERLAKRLAAGPGGDPRRQIGFISEELN